MRLQEFLQERERLNNAIQELLRLELYVNNAHGHEFKVGSRSMYTSDWSLPNSLRETIVASISDKRRDLEKQLATLESRCTIV